MQKKFLSVLLALALLFTLIVRSGEAAEGDPQYGGVLRYASHFTTSTPGYTPENTNNASLTFLTIAYESLLYYDTDGSMIPKLAVEWTMDAEEPSLTWKLRQGVKFADGADFNAEAVKINIEEYQKFGRNETANIDRCEIIDDHTIKMHLKAWNSSTLEAVGFFVYYMSPEALKDVDTLRESSCGTGPFQIVEFNPGISFKYVRNDNYWREGKPYLDGIEIYVVEEPTTRSFAFQAGEYDIITMNDLTVAFQLDNSGQYVRQDNLSGQGLVATGLIPRSSDPESPFADHRVRQAMCYAIDTDAIINAFGYGMLIGTNQWAAPGAPTFNPNVRGYPHDIEKAKALLAEAGYPDGFNTIMTTNAGNRDMFTAAANMLGEAGIRCEINLVDETAQVHLYSTGTWQGIMGHYHSITPDLGLYMGRHLDYEGAFYSAGILHPDEPMALLQAIRVAPSIEEKLRLEHEMQILIYDELALFGQPMFVQNEPTFKYGYVMDDNRSVQHVHTWSLENAWLNK